VGKDRSLHPKLSHLKGGILKTSLKTSQGTNILASWNPTIADENVDNIDSQSQYYKNLKKYI